MMAVDGQSNERLVLDGAWCGQKERLVQVTLTFDGGPFVGFVTEAAKRPQLESLVAALEAAGTPAG